MAQDVQGNEPTYIFSLLLLLYFTASTYLCSNSFSSVLEFIPYVFQLLSLLLELHETGTIPEPYMKLFPCLLVPVLWDRPGNIHPLVRLLRAFIHKGAAQIAESQKIVGVFEQFHVALCLIPISVCDYLYYFLSAEWSTGSFPKASCF